MKKVALYTALTLALAASPALSQGRSGGAPGGGPPAGVGGGPGGGNGAGPPMSVPGQSADPAATARDIANERGQFGRDFAEQQSMTQAEQARHWRDTANKFVARSEHRKAEAMARREAALAGEPIDMSSKEIRDELKEDMEEWRDAFRIGRED